jgi:hypothetical protein
MGRHLPLARRALAAGLFLAVAVIGAASCGGSSTTESSRPLRACALVTPAQVEQLTGWNDVETSRARGAAPAGVDVCSYEPKQRGALVQIQVSRLWRERAYEELDHGTVGARVGDHFVRVISVGPGLTDAQQRAIAHAARKGTR